MFKRAKQSRVFQDVVDQIQEAILTKKLAPGTRLPAERDLKEMFNTSRAIPEDIQELGRLQSKARRCYETRDWETFLKTDEAMHTYIGTMTRNPVFQFSGTPACFLRNLCNRVLFFQLFNS